jgi:hypothetical protein
VLQVTVDDLGPGMPHEVFVPMPLIDQYREAEQARWTSSNDCPGLSR